jgi:hypothetical protein
MFRIFAIILLVTFAGIRGAAAQIVALGASSTTMP